MLRLLTWENSQIRGPLGQRTKSTEQQMRDNMRSRSELLLNQKTDFIHTFQPMDAPRCPRALKLPLLPHILFHPLMEIVLWHTFPSTPDGPIHHYQHCHPPWFFSNIQRPLAAIFFSLLQSKLLSCNSRPWLRSGAYTTQAFPHCLGTLWEFTV